MTDSTPAPTREIGDDETAGVAMLLLEPWTWSTEFTLGASAFPLDDLFQGVVRLGDVPRERRR